MNIELEELEKRVSNGRNYDSPPLHLWHPELSGDIDIVVSADGKWHHEGSEITRQSIVKLFASILRREQDGQYYLVTPGEKWRIQVELHALLVIQLEWVQAAPNPLLRLGLNTGRSVLVGPKHPLVSEPSLGNIAAVTLGHGLSALFSRNSWYQLVEMAEKQGDQLCIVSDGERYILG